MRPLLASALLALAALTVVAAAGAGQRDGVPAGSYTILDGPQAGVDVHVGAGGTAGILDRSAELRAVPAGDGCDHPHLVGTIAGRAQPHAPCGWGAIALLRELPPVVGDLANAITEEERAVAALTAVPPQSGHWELALYGQLGLEHALAALDAAEKDASIDSATAARVRGRLDAAHTIDESVKKRQQAAGKKATAAQDAVFVRDLRNALSLKREAFETAVDELAPQSSARRCTAEKPFEIFAVPAGYTGAYTEVYPHGVPRGAKNVKVAFVDAATGAAAPHEVFPGQTWTATVKGFKPDGSLIVHLDLTGTGLGKPDEHHRSWKVIVSYDCP